MIYLIVAAIVIGLGMFAWKLTSRSGYESARYTVLKTDGVFEIREYPDLMLATTASDVRSEGNDGSFGRLFKYISGKNKDQTKIAMTTPVFMEPAPEQADGQMGFVLPAEYADESIPDPSGSDVQIRKRQGGKFAVVRFAGQMNEGARKDAEQRLRKWIEADGLTAEQSVEFAGYDPPWTPGVFRRNEILIRVQ